jgi:hypothetical protein
MIREWLANIAHRRAGRLQRAVYWWLDVEEWLSTALPWRAIRGDKGHGKEEEASRAEDRAQRGSTH